MCNNFSHCTVFAIVKSSTGSVQEVSSDLLPSSCLRGVRLGPNPFGTAFICLRSLGSQAAFLTAYHISGWRRIELERSRGWD